MDIYEKLVQYFLDSGELGYYDPSNLSICLYDVKKKDIADLRKRIAELTKKCRVVVEYPNDDYTNVNILDIGV